MGIETKSCSDQRAMELLKQFELAVIWFDDGHVMALQRTGNQQIEVRSSSLNRAIVECVVKIKEAQALAQCPTAREALAVQWAAIQRHNC